MIPWHWLTRSDLKARLYGRETYFREGAADAQEIFGDSLEAGLRLSSMILVKADGLVAGKLAAVVDYVCGHDFAVVEVDEVRFTRQTWRELWRFQLTSASLDRLAVNDAVHPGRTALLLLLRSGAGYDLPGTVRLSGLKGSAAAPAEGSLRDLLDQPNRVFSFVHVPDEPADLLRELGLLLDPDARRRALVALASDHTSSECAARLAQAVRAHAQGALSLAPSPSAGRVAGAIEAGAASGALPAGRAALLRRYLANLDGGRPVPWRTFYRLADHPGLSCDPWDLAVLGAAHVACDEPGFDKVLTNPDPESWRPGSGR